MNFEYGNPGWALLAASQYAATAKNQNEEAKLTAAVAQVEQHLMHFMTGGMTRDQAVAMVAFSILITDIPQIGTHPSTRTAVEIAMARTLCALGSLAPPVHLDRGED